MKLQDYLTVSNYFRCCWTKDHEGLANLFDPNATQFNEHKNTGVAYEKEGVEAIMEDYLKFFSIAKLPSTIVHELKIYNGDNFQIVAEYDFYQEKEVDKETLKEEFKAIETFELTEDGTIKRVVMSVYKKDI
jgi:hypothetical protein